MSYAKLRGSYSDCDPIKFTSSGGDSAGDVLNVGDLYGVVRDDVADGEEGVLIVRTDNKGILMPKDAGVAVSAHTKAYIITADLEVTDDDNSAANPQIGYFVEDAAGGDAEAVVHLIQATI